MPYLPFQARPIDPSAEADVLAVARGAGVHGVYVANDLTSTERDGEAVVLFGAEEVLGLLWFGRRGNLIVIHDDRVDPTAIAREVRGSGWPWRIALGPHATVGALVEQEKDVPLVDRRQVYYGLAPEGIARTSGPEVRAAERADVPRLVECALALNQVDLNVDPGRVDRGWLRRNVLARMEEGATWVTGPPGALDCKLDFGSRGGYGVVIEGVYTREEARGQGLATHLVATCSRQLVGAVDLVCLHVDEANRPARSAYERAGLREMGECRIMLAR